MSTSSLAVTLDHLVVEIERLVEEEYFDFREALVKISKQACVSKKRLMESYEEYFSK